MVYRFLVKFIDIDIINHSPIFSSIEPSLPVADSIKHLSIYRGLANNYSILFAQFIWLAISM